jgi:murein DD-endopeptidase MepM/ murein hydrolase activator NlpD
MAVPGPAPNWLERSPQPAAPVLSTKQGTLALDRSPRGAEPVPNRDARYTPRPRAGHRRRPPASPWQGRVALAAVATGATVAAAPNLLNAVDTAQYRDVAHTAAGALIESSSGYELVKRAPARGPAPHVAAALPPGEDETDIADMATLTKAVKVGEELAANALRVKQALADGVPEATIFNGQEFVKPTDGVFTSGFGGRWGTTHYGIDLANQIGTPIYAVTDGTVISSGPASGFGLWVRLLHPGGWISVYGHINRSLVHIGEVVKAGQEIAEMGNRGQSTGPHLHFEVWDPSGRKINPLPWLAARGIRVVGAGNGAAD